MDEQSWKRRAEDAEREVETLRVEVDRLEDWQDKIEGLRTANLARAEAAERERDAAFARVEDQEAQFARLKMTLDRITHERDAARAEVARLREAAAQSMALCSWGCSDEVYCGRCAPLTRALAALDEKEE